ncbi:MAG: AgmX/PglI C-terminal domain-containing protein [candidate division Zixibacteria bacterium]|nr:AgmX/PglI C-terminal domain-containing protein [candidate division Zixibacteria bacterium]
MAITKSRKEVLGLRVIRDGKVLKELDLEDRLTIGGARTDHVITAGDKKSAVLFRTAKNGEAEILLAENYRGEIGGDGEMLSFAHLKTLGLLKREGGRYVVPIQRGRSGFVQADGLTFEFAYRPPLPVKEITIPKRGPGYAAVGVWIDPDNIRYYRVLAVVGAVFVAFMVGSQYARIEEREFRVEDLVSRVTKLEVPEAVGVSTLEEGEGEGVGVGPGGGGRGAGNIGAGIPATGVVAAITTLGGTGSGKYLADLLGAGGSSGDLDGIAARLGGLRGTYGGGGVGGALGPGSGDGTGLGGGVDLLSGLGGGYGGRGPYGGKLRKKTVSVSGAISSLAGPGTADAQRSPQVIASVIRRHLTGIQNAYNSALKKNPNLGSGKITIRFTILASGSVGSVSIIQDTLSSPVLSGAILVRVRGWKFPEVKSGSVTVVYPFVFVASEV